MARDEGCDFGIDLLDPALEQSDSYRLKQSTGRHRSPRAEQNQATQIVDPDTGEITAA